jgi:hydroxymethylbilane synthase
MWQARHVAARLSALYPDCRIEILGMTTRGDKILDKSLAEIGGKGLFMKELEQAIEEGRADLAVHSLKDVPMDLPPGFVLATIMSREDPRDALVSNAFGSLAEIPDGSLIGTSSLRREAQLRERFPMLEVASLRGNVNTRLKKLDDGNYSAIILAAAGLKRLGLAGRIAALIDPAESLPAPGQGALTIECLAGRAEIAAALRPLTDEDTTIAVTAERAFARRLSASCHTPLAAYAQFRDDRLWLRGLVASRDGRQVLRGERRSFRNECRGERSGRAWTSARRRHRHHPPGATGGGARAAGRGARRNTDHLSRHRHRAGDRSGTARTRLARARPL